MSKMVALWIKEYTHPLRVIGGVFFVLAFISGLASMMGMDIEAVPYTLSFVSSSFFASPSIAQYVLPDRKPVKNMSHDELLQFIKGSDSKKDWTGINIDNAFVSEVFLKEDPRLRFRATYMDEGIQCDDFKDKWANCHPDPHATGYWYDLYYDGNIINRFILVSIDGGKAYLPPPDWKTGKIHIMEYRVAQLHDTLNTLDEYIKRSNLEIDKTT